MSLGLIGYSTCNKGLCKVISTITGVPPNPYALHQPSHLPSPSAYQNTVMHAWRTLLPPGLASQWQQIEAPNRSPSLDRRQCPTIGEAMMESLKRVFNPFGA